ncbi:MAG TPA: ferritin-like domain-containing protein [Candidatus Eisenbacteria bacterium]|nr:ferritin-like domain-containing protein [Candidatus Eisenbacteria bacterium]
MAKAKKESAEMGMNKTGLATAPKLSKEMIESSESGPVSASHGGMSPASVRAGYIKERETIGSVPPPTSMKGAGKTAMAALKGEKATVFLDKLGERLAFERSGTRLYEALIEKCRALGTNKGGVTIPQLERICHEELKHFHMLWDCIEQLGADPTVEMPSADVAAVISGGIPKVITDPRTTLAQCLEAMLAAELVDNDGWEMLIELADEFEQTEMAEKFREALAEEENHLSVIRECLKREIRQEARLTA